MFYVVLSSISSTKMQLLGSVCSELKGRRVEVLKFNNSLVDLQKELISLFNAGCVEIIDANMIGIEDSDGYMVTVDRLLGSTYIPFRKKIYGIYIPSGDIVTRTNYRWFSELSVSDIMKSKIIIGELFRNM